MASIVLSYVGNQDPYSPNTKEEGSIVTLIKHLINNSNIIKKIVLLYTDTTKDGAELTKEWLETELKIDPKITEIIAVDSQLSEDPVNLLLATQSARQTLENQALPDKKTEDILEFNASSGTPVMKSAWSILQASGYAPNSRVWQVRNPKKLLPGQEPVFETNVTVIKNEFDVKLIKRQVENYNYSGALATLETTNLVDNQVRALLEYGEYRLAFDFDKAFNVINKSPDTFNPMFKNQLGGLRSSQISQILQEVYYKISIYKKNKQYADFLMLIFAFQENILRFLVKQKLLPENLVNKPWNQIRDQFSTALKNEDQERLYKYLKQYRLRNGNSLNIDLEKPPSRIFLQAILEYYPDSSNILQLVQQLDQFSEQRNDVIHELQGISELPEEEEIIRILSKLLKSINSFSADNPYDILNSHINLLLDNYLRGQN